MPDPQTSNLQLFQPIRGSDVGTWDVPVNANTGILDLAVGGVASITLNNSPVTLASSQYEAKTLIFSSTLTGNVPITFPTSFIKSWEIYNTCTGSSAFVVTLTTGSGQVVAAPPGETIEIFSDGANLRYKNFDRIGSYWDYAGSSVPAWVSACTIPPYLLCGGGSFSSAVYPQLTVILGGTTLPDQRGRFRMNLDQGAGRVSSAASNVAGNTNLAGGGTQTQTIGSSNIPAHSHPVSDPGHQHTVGIGVSGGAAVGPPQGQSGGVVFTVNTNSVVTGLTVSNSTYANGAFPIMPPTLVGGITLIRAA